ncbi:MAG TPA: DUF1330 domain-containing protein [Terriglobales bacterium]|nr:DUF1330 domain-containing protein [Terriglobales bacterium]
MTYVIVTIKALRDPEAFQQYAERAKPIIDRHGGQYIVIEKAPEVRDGQWHFVRTVIVAFPSFEAALGWYDSPEYREIIPLRKRAFDANIALVRDLSEAPVEGYPLPAASAPQRVTSG